jgi:hypothetical protein
MSSPNVELIMQFPPVSSYFLSFRPKYVPHHADLEYLQSVFFLNVRIPIK